MSREGLKSGISRADYRSLASLGMTIAEKMDLC
jgi:hypothetical protein